MRDFLAKLKIGVGGDRPDQKVSGSEVVHARREHTSSLEELTEDEEAENNKNLHKLRIRTFYAYFRFRDYLNSKDEQQATAEISEYYREIDEALAFYEKITDEFYRCTALHMLVDIFTFAEDRNAAKVALSSITIDFIKEKATETLIGGRENASALFEQVSGS